MLTFFASFQFWRVIPERYPAKLTIFAQSWEKGEGRLARPWVAASHFPPQALAHWLALARPCPNCVPSQRPVQFQTRLGQAVPRKALLWFLFLWLRPALNGTSPSSLTAVEFEPTQLALVELESTPLDHSGKLSCCYCAFEKKPSMRALPSLLSASG